MARIPLNTLPAFRAVARLANLRAAADQLHLTHSAVSQQIRLLEQQIGFELFDRRARRIVLNAAGSNLLRAVEPALAQIDEGLRNAAATAAGARHQLRVAVLPSFAQRWLLPRMGHWRDKHPDIGIELDASQHLVDLQREGFQAALRQGSGRWRGLEAVQLIDSPLIAVGSAAAASRLAGRDIGALADEPLLGNPARWQAWFAQAGLSVRINPVATFNDAGLMLQAAEQDIGIALTRELLAADALRDGTLVRLSPLALQDDRPDAYWLAYPGELRDWPPLNALREWLRSEMAQSRRALRARAGAPTPITPAAETTPAGRTGSRSRAPSAPRAPSRAR